MIEQKIRLQQQQKQRVIRQRQQQQQYPNNCNSAKRCYRRTMVTGESTSCALLATVFLLMLLDDNGGYISVVESFSCTITSSSKTTTTNKNILYPTLQRYNYQTNKLILLHRPSKLYSNKKSQNIENDTNNNDYDDEDDPLEQTTEPKERNIFDLLFNPYSSTVIPPEIAKDIYIAEGNTIAARERTQRILLYCVIAFVSILLAFFNGFLTELRSNPPPTLPDGTSIIMDSNNNIDSIAFLDAFGFGWVYSNVVTTFLLTNKIGGVLCLLLGGASGLLAEAEYDTRRINAEKIYTELIKRRQQSGNSATSKSSRNSSTSSNKKAKRRSNSKEAKRLNALSEVTPIATDKLSPSMSDVTITTKSSTLTSTTAGRNADTEANNNTNPERGETNDSPNLLDRVKDFYQQADTMAMTQALLMNKQLEDQGILPKITDETGLKVLTGVSAASASRTTATTNTDSNSTSMERKVEKEKS